jgi:uncharacterized protein YciI
MYYLVLATDAPDTASKREEIGPIHRAYLRNPGNHRVKVHLGGPTLTMQHEQTNGTLLIVEADEMSAVSEFIADDPYAQAGVFQSVEIRPWAWTLGQPAPVAETAH